MEGTELVGAQRHAELFQSVGAVVVAGGHVEWRLQRLLLWIRNQGPSDFPSIARMNWSDLVKAVRLVATRSPKADEIAALMQEADDQNLKVARDNVVHANWWMDGGEGIRGSRHPHKGGGYIVVGQTEDLHRVASQLFEFANRLAELTPDDGWPVMLRPVD